MISRLTFLGQYGLWSSQTFVFLFGGLGGLVGRLISGVTDWLRAGMETLLDKLFAVAIEAFLLIDNPYGVTKANEAWMNSFEVALAIFPVMIIMGLLSMPFADEQKTSLWRQGLRIVGVIAIIAVSRPLIGFGVDLSNAMTVALMPTGSDLMTMLLPGDNMMSSLASSFSALSIVLIIYFLGVYMLIALGVVLILLQLRVFFIYLVFIASPILAVFWYADWGMMESISEFANKWARMGIYTLLSGPIIAIIFRTMFVIGSGALVEGADGAVEGVAAFWSHFVLVTCFPIIMIAAVWKIVSWAGEPIGAGQAMTGMSMAFGAAAGAMIGSVGASGSAAAGSQSGQQAASAGGAGSPGGGGGGATAGGGSGGLAGAPGSASAAGPGNGQGRLAEAVRDQDGGSVSANDSATASSPGAGPAATSASGSGTVPKGGVEGDIPGGTGGSDGPSDDVTGAGSPPASEEPQGYINAAKERYGNFKERNVAAMNEAVSQYKDTAKDRLNPTNIERKRGEMKRQQAAGLEQGQQQFEDAIDMNAGDHGTIDLEQAEASGALRDSVKATNYDTAEPATASLSEDGTFEYRNENDEMVQGSIGAKNQQFRDQQEALREEADMHDDRADRIDQSMNETGARLKKTGGNLRNKYGPAMNEARHAFGREAVRGTVGAHSPYLMAGGSGVFGGGQRGEGGANAAGAGPGGPEAQEAAGQPESSVSAETAMEHQDLLNETGERFDVSDREYGFEPGGGRTPDGVSQQGYLTNPETGDRVAPVEVSENSGVSLSSDESFKLGNVGMGKRDGESSQSLPSESGEYGAISVDEHSRTYDDGEVRADQVIGNSEMIGEEVSLKDHTIRESPGESENYEGQYFAESPNGERIPINAGDGEANEALGEMVGQKADLTGTIENQYGMSKDTHPEYEGAHDYNAMNISLGDQDGAGTPEGQGEGGSSSSGGSGDGSEGTEVSGATASAGKSSTHSIEASSGFDNSSGPTRKSESNSNNGHGVSASSGSDSGSSSNSNSGHSSGGSVKMDAAELTGERMDQAEKMWDYPDNADVSIPDDALYEYEPEPATHETQKSKGSFKLLNGDEISGDAPDRIGAIAFNGGEIKDENGNVQLNKNGEPKTMPEDGNWNFDSVPEGENPVIQGQDFNDVQARHFYDSESEHSHEHAGEMAAEHGGEQNAYAQIRPSDATDMSGHTHTGAIGSKGGNSPQSDDPTGATTSRQEGTSPDETVPESPNLSESGEAGASTSSHSGGESHSSSFSPSSGEHIENATESHETIEESPSNNSMAESETETTGYPSESASETGGGSPEPPEYGGEIELRDESVSTEGIDGLEDLHGERVDAHGVGRSTVLDDAAIGSTEVGSESEIMLADDTRENSRAEYGEGKLEGINHGDSFAVKNAEVHSPDDQGSDVLRMDENTEVEPTEGHEGPATMSVGSGRAEFQVEAGEDIEEVEKVEDGGGETGGDGSDSDNEGGTSASHSGGGEPEEGGEEDHPLNPGSGASTAGEHSGEDVNDGDWEEYARNWREHHDETKSETLGEHDGFTAESMHVETLDNGEKAYITDYDDLEKSLAEENIMGQPRAEELKHQSLVGHEWSEAMDQEVPNVAYNEDENEIIQQEAGGADTETWDINDAPDEALEQVDRDEYEETMAVQLLGGNLDTSEDNVHVDENGGLHVIDFDRTASSMGEVDSTDELEINAGPAARIGHKIGKVNEDFHTDKFQYEEELAQKSVDIATELESNGQTDDVLSGVEELDDAHSGVSKPRAPVIRHNIETLADQEVEMDKSRGATDEDIAAAFDDLESSDEVSGSEE